MVAPMGDKLDICALFGREVRRYRQAVGLSQEALAARAGLDRTYVSGVERGLRNVSLKNLHILARALGVTIGELVRGIDAADGR